MFFNSSVICKGRDYIKGKVQGIICFTDSFAMRNKRAGKPTIPIVFNNHKIGAESIINCDGIIIFEECFNEAIKDIIDKIKVPCVIIPHGEARVEKVSALVGNKLEAKEGEQIVIDGKKIVKV